MNKRIGMLHRMKPRRWYNVEQISVLLNVDKETVRRWVRSKKLYATAYRGKQGKDIVVHYRSLQEFLMKNSKRKYQQIYYENLKAFSIHWDERYGEYSESALLDLIDAKERYLQQIQDLKNEIEECNIYIQMIDDHLKEIKS